MADTEKLGQAIDRIENILYASQIPMPAEFHLNQIQEILPEIITELKEGFIEVTGENPWR